MVVPDYNYRVRPERAIYIVGEFNDALMQNVIPRITSLRGDNNEPISLIISSHGGEVPCLNAIICALSARDPDGNETRVISYATGHALSCGAILLTSADYAIATFGSTIHFHGIRMNRYDLTTESAIEIANNLSQENKTIADNMAKAMMPRLMHRFLRLKKDIDKQRKKRRRDTVPLVIRFSDLAMKMMGPNAADVFYKAIGRLIRVRQINASLGNLKYGRKDTPLQKDAKLLERIIHFELKDSSSPGLRLNEDGIGQLISDYLTIRDFHLGDHNYFLDNFIRFWGPDFLNARDLREYNRLLPISKRKAFSFLKAQVIIDVQDFWYLTVCIARALLFGENELNTVDAYWLGAIDEIAGMKQYFGVRTMMEKT